MRRLAAAGLVTLGLLGLGGTCQAPPPWHDVSGTWVAVSADDGQSVALERPGGGSEEAHVGLVLALESTVPEDREPLPVEGSRTWQWTTAAPALAASRAELAICSGVTGMAGCLPTVSPPPVTAQVMMTFDCMKSSC